MINFGKSGAEATVFPPRPSGPRQAGGLVAATMGLVTGLRAGAYSAPDDLVLGLLSKAPTPEGLHWVEVIGEGYVRQPLILAHGPVSNGHVQLLNRDPISFGPYDASWSIATHIAAFGRGDAMQAYGGIVPADIARGNPDRLRFAAARLILRYRAA